MCLLLYVVHSCGQMAVKEDYVANGANLVWQYVLELRSSRELPFDIWSSLDDRIRGSFEYLVINKYAVRF